MIWNNCSISEASRQDEVKWFSCENPMKIASRVTFTKIMAQKDSSMISLGKNEPIRFNVMVVGESGLG